VAILGGRGFLGSHLSKRLEGHGATVLTCDRRTEHDLRRLDRATAFLDEAKPDVVFNLAANQGGVAYQAECPGTILYDNSLIMLNVLEAVRLAGVPRLVNIIAACAYPDNPRDGMLREDEFEAGPMHESADNYGISKRLAVMQAKHYRRQYDMGITSLVLANCYGPRDHFSSERSHVLAALLRRFLDARRDGSDEVIVWGRGIAERDLLYVDDAITGMLFALDRCADAPLLNIGTGHGSAVAEIAETIRLAVGYKGKVTFDPSKPEGPLKKILDVTRMRNLLDWTPPTSLASGVGQTLHWLEEHYEEAVSSH
jgi:GDP-L-fucose synthase